MTVSPADTSTRMPACTAAGRAEAAEDGEGFVGLVLRLLARHPFGAARYPGGSSALLLQTVAPPGPRTEH